MEWTQALTIIGSIMVPMLAGFGWMVALFLKQGKELGDKISGVSEKVSHLGERLSKVEGYLEGRDRRRPYNNGTED